MNLTRSLFALSIAAASQAHATCYDLTGEMTGANAVSPSSPTAIYVHTGSTAYSTSPSTFPTFTGYICIDTSVTPATISGVYIDMPQYSMSYRVLTLTAVLNQPHVVYSFKSPPGTTVFLQEPPPKITGEGPFALGQPGITTDASLQFDVAHGAILGSCSGNTTLCSSLNTNFLMFPDMEKFYMSVTIEYDPAVGKFKLVHGTGLGGDGGVSGSGGGGGSGGGLTGGLSVGFSFSGNQH